jgi:hypothetical protein
MNCPLLFTIRLIIPNIIRILVLKTRVICHYLRIDSAHDIVVISIVGMPLITSPKRVHAENVKLLLLKTRQLFKDVELSGYVESTGVEPVKQDANQSRKLINCPGTEITYSS